jgi:hypothetical protein
MSPTSDPATLAENLMAEASQRDTREGSDTAGDDWLMAELGRQAAAAAPAGMAAEMAESDAGARGLGARILARLEREAHGLLCGKSQQDKDDRAALGISSDVAITAITTALTAGLSVGPQAAAIAAALIVRRLAAPTVEEACAVWSERLDTAG